MTNYQGPGQGFDYWPQQQPQQPVQQPQFPYSAEVTPPPANMPLHPPPFAQPEPAPEPRFEQQSKKGKAVAAALITGAAVAVLAVPAGVAIGWFMHEGQYFEQAAIETEVGRVLAEDYGLAEISEVACPPEVKAEQGAVFECTYVLNETTQSVPVTVSSEDGQLLIGSPVE